MEQDYLNLARELLKDSPLGPMKFTLETPQPYELVMRVSGQNYLRELAAAHVLREHWLYDWMPVIVRIAFKPALGLT